MSGPNGGTGARALILAAAVLFSTGGAAIKACDLSAWQVASFRSGLAALTLLVLIPSARRGWNRRTLAVGLAYAATMVLYVTANKLTTAANTIFLQSTAPLYILLFGPWLLGERTRRRDLLFTAAMAAGLVLFFVAAETVSVTAPDPFRGNLVAAVSGASWALTLVGLRWLGRDGSGEGAARAVAAGNLLACLGALPMALPIGTVPAQSWAVVAYLGVVQIAIAYLCLTRGIRRIGALEASLLLLLEPVLNPLWALLFHRELPGGWALVGGAVIVAATAAKTWFDARRAQA